jgi:hypothetical protein
MRASVPALLDSANRLAPATTDRFTLSPRRPRQVNEVAEESARSAAEAAR